MAEQKEPVVKVNVVANDKPEPGDAEAQPVIGAQSLVPPDEQFWERYSPNHEMSISSLVSAVGHIFMLLTLLFGLGWLLNIFNRGGDPDLEPVIVGDKGGGGGHVEGVGDAPGNRSRPKDVEANLDKNDSKQPTLPTKDDPSNNANQNTNLEATPDAQDLIERAKQRAPQAAPLGPVLKDALIGLAGKGRGGSGSGGGLGSGKGKGTGDGVGDGSGTKRGRRVLRWTMKFDVTTGREYIRQLNMCGAILGIPQGNGETLVVRDLTKLPVQGKIEDVKALNRIFWVDNNPDSMQSMAITLGLDKVPTEIYAFMPFTLEKTLLERELAYGKKYGRNTEESIEETVFQLRFRGGKPEPVVVEQRGKK
jgi:hypothetical protein